MLTALMVLLTSVIHQLVVCIKASETLIQVASLLTLPTTFGRLYQVVALDQPRIFIT